MLPAGVIDWAAAVLEEDPFRRPDLRREEGPLFLPQISRRGELRGPHLYSLSSFLGDGKPGLEEKLNCAGTAGYLRIRGFPAQQVRFRPPWASPLAGNPLAAGLAAHPRLCLTRRGCSRPPSELPSGFAEPTAPCCGDAQLHFGGSLSEDLVLHERFAELA